MSNNHEQPKRVQEAIRIRATKATFDALRQESRDEDTPMSRILGGMLEERYAAKENR